MIGYVLSENELKVLLAITGTGIVPGHCFSDTDLMRADYERAINTLAEKGFLRTAEEKLIIDHGINIMIRHIGKASTLLVGNGRKKFTAYISDKLSLLLIDDENSDNIILYPFENKQLLVEWLNEEGLFLWNTITIKDGTADG